MLSSMFLINLVSVARDSDKLRILSKLRFAPTIAYTTFALGYFTLIWGLTCHLYILFGKPACIGFIVMCSVVGGIFPLLLNNCYMLKIGHSTFYWYKKHREDYLSRMVYLVDKMEEKHIKEHFKKYN